MLEQTYDAMTAHVRRVESLLSPTGLWDTGFQFGDWLDPTAPPDDPADAKADKGVVATACLYRSARLTAEAAQILGRAADAEHFRALAERTRAAFTEHYVSDDGTVHSDAQTVYALAIVFGLLDEPVRQKAGDRLAALVAESGYRISTGFAGTPFVTDALTATGHLDDAYRMLLAAGVPVVAVLGDHGGHHRLGALGLDAARREHQPRPDDELQPLRPRRRRGLDAPGVGGIAPAEPGYRTVRVAPRPGGGLTWAKTSLDTRHGRSSSSGTSPTATARCRRHRPRRGDGRGRAAGR